MTKETQNGQSNTNLPDKGTARWMWLCGIGYGIFGVGVVLINIRGFALMGLLCIYGGMVVGSVGFVGKWYNKSQITSEPLKIALCTCLILGIGGCVVDMTLPDDFNFPIAGNWPVFLVGESSNWFVLISTAGWILFLLGEFIINFRIK